MRQWLPLLAGLAACSSPTGKSDWERQHESQLPRPEETVALPAYPAEQRLIEFFVAATSEFRFFVDSASVSVGNDGVVRYALVARSSAGADNVSFEACVAPRRKCASTLSGATAAGCAGPASGARSSRAACSAGITRSIASTSARNAPPIASREEGIYALRRGGHQLYEDTTEGGSGSGW